MRIESHQSKVRGSLRSGQGITDEQGWGGSPRKEERKGWEVTADTRRTGFIQQRRGGGRRRRRGRGSLRREGRGRINGGELGKRVAAEEGVKVHGGERCRGFSEEGGDTPPRSPRPQPRNPGTLGPGRGRQRGARARADRRTRLGLGGDGGVRLGSGRTRLTSDPGPAGSEPAAPPSHRASPRPRSLPGFGRHLGGARALPVMPRGGASGAGRGPGRDHPRRTLAPEPLEGAGTQRP